MQQHFLWHLGGTDRVLHDAETGEENGVQQHGTNTGTVCARGSTQGQRPYLPLIMFVDNSEVRQPLGSVEWRSWTADKKEQDEELYRLLEDHQDGFEMPQPGMPQEWEEEDKDVQEPEVVTTACPGGGA